MTRFLLTLLCLAGLTATAVAQERTAGQAYDAQVNWSTLMTKLNALDTQNKALALSLTALQTSVTNLTTTVNALSSKVLVMDNKLSAIAACGAQQKYWNGAACVAAGAASLPTLQAATFTENVNYGGHFTPSVAYCVSKGYDTLASVTTSTSTRHTGGREGQDTTYTSGYHMTCLRVVNR